MGTSRRSPVQHRRTCTPRTSTTWAMLFTSAA